MCEHATSRFMASIPNDVLQSFEIQDTLNPDIWMEDMTIKPEIRKRLLEIAKRFFEDLDLGGAKLHDVTLTGSISNFNWSKFSDIDLHLRIKFSEVDENEELVRNLVQAKKTVWNQAHDITIKGFPVEVYVENVGETHVASGLYSILRDEWLVKPERTHLSIDKDDIATKATAFVGYLKTLQKWMDLGRYDDVIAGVKKIQNKLKRMRQAGLESGGEYSVENLAFKALRRSPFIAQIVDLRQKAYDKSLSMDEMLNEAHPLRDKVLRTVANDAFSKIIAQSAKVRNWRNDSVFKFFKKPEIFGFVVAVHKIVPNIEKLHLAIVPEEAGGSNHYNLEGKVIRMKAIPKKMVIDMMAGKISKAKEIASVFKYCMDRDKPTFIHEFTHYVDFDKRNIAKATYGRGTGSDRAEDNMGEYLNSPEEFNAFYQSGAKQLEDMVKEAMKDESFLNVVQREIPKNFNEFIRSEFGGATRSPLLGSQSVFPGKWLNALTPTNKRKFIKRVAPLHKWAVSKLYAPMEEAAERDYKKEYEKYQSSPEKKKYRAQLNKYNRDKGTYGNGDNKDASHKNGKIVGFEDSSKNKGRAEKSRLKGSKRNTTNEEIMIKLMDILREVGGGQAAGSMEVATTPVNKAVAYVKDSKYYEPDTFERNYTLAQKKAKIGFAKRRDMPVINISDVQKLQTRLKNGTIDIDKPFAKDTPDRNPFPQGLSGQEAKDFLQNGIRLKDGDEKDDIVQTKMATVALKDLKPIQKQIYFDKSWDDMIQKFGADSTKKFIENSSILISSNDNFILDGHHRFLAGMILDPNLKAKVLKIDLPIKTLLPLLLAYGDAIGNKRNL